MKKLSETLKEKIQKPKTQMALGLAVTAMGIVAPASSQSIDYCKIPGTYGDCEMAIPQGFFICTQGSFWNDCDIRGE